MVGTAARRKNGLCVAVASDTTVVSTHSAVSARAAKSAFTAAAEAVRVWAAELPPSDITKVKQRLLALTGENKNDASHTSA
eukprot:2908918-Pyramimonas_sp.AAC.1